ncbi:MAG: inovirus-type Gp2 protein [Lentisphaeria bacterium]|nr:inovirus-type Gp2 protein [Lentisphaeria bacterium]
MKKRNLIFDKVFQDNPVLQFTRQNIGLDADILQKLHEHFDYKIAHCPRTFVMRFDVHMPQGIAEQDNKVFSRFQAHFIKKEKRAGYDPEYFAVREESSNSGVHYHEVLFLDGKKTERIYSHIKNANDALNSTLGLPEGTLSGLINDCTKDRKGKSQRNGIMIERGSCTAAKSEKDCFRQASYLAKDSQKDSTGKWQHEIFSSRIPASNKKA